MSKACNAATWQPHWISHPTDFTVNFEIRVQCKDSLCNELQDQRLAESLGGKLPHELELVPNVLHDGMMMFAISGSHFLTESHQIWPLDLARGLHTNIALFTIETKLDPGLIGHLEFRFLCC